MMDAEDKKKDATTRLTRREALRTVLRGGALAGLAALAVKASLRENAAPASASLARCEGCARLAGCLLPEGVQARRFFGKGAAPAGVEGGAARCGGKDGAP
jgi:hypothetical protein